MVRGEVLTCVTSFTDDPSIPFVSNGVGDCHESKDVAAAPDRGMKRAPDADEVASGQ